jgi:hypothetical protein
MKPRLFLSAALISALSLGSCSRHNTSTDQNISLSNQANMSYELNATNASSSSHEKMLAGGTFHWTSGYANPTLVRFEAKQQGTKIEYTSTNTSLIDLFAPIALDFGGFVLPAGVYREIELSMRLNGHGTDPALILSGTYMSSTGMVTPIVVRIEDELWIKTEMQDVAVDPGSTIASIVDLDLSIFMNGISDVMIQGAYLTNGTLIISRDSNRDLYNRILSNITGKRHHGHYKHHH